MILSKQKHRIKDIEWDQINWPNCEFKIARLQQRIYRESLKGNKYTVRFLQKTLIKTASARFLAVRKVTTENQGRKTGGVDRQIITTSQQKITMARKLRIDGYANPIRRVMIPKPGKSEKRPLGIPTIKDRAKQMLVKMVLEPE